MKNKAFRIRLIMALLLAVLCCFMAVRLPLKDAETERVSLSDASKALLLYPKRASVDRVPGVLLCWSDTREQLLCRMMAGELVRRDYICCIAPSGSEKEGWKLLSERCSHAPKGCLGFNASGEALRVLSLSETEEAPCCTVLLYVSTPELWEGSAEKMENVLLQLTQGVDKPGTEGFAVEKWADTEGCFGEGTARRAERVPEDMTQIMYSVIDWVGSSLGRPNDGMLPDNEFLFNRQLVLVLLSAAYLVYAPVSALRGRKKKTPPDITVILGGDDRQQEEP